MEGDGVSLRTHRPRLPIELCERVFDMLRKPVLWDDDEIRRTLQACSLVCRAWVPRCRFYLCQRIYISSADDLQRVSTLLYSSDRFAAQVMFVEIRGGGPNQSWISSVPLRLPKLPSLEELILSGIDFSQQHCRFHQCLSLLRPIRLIVRNYDLGQNLPDQSHLRQLAAIAVAVHAHAVYVNTGMLDTDVIRSQDDVKLLNCWPRRLTSLIQFSFTGTLELLGEVIPHWRFPLRSCSLSLKRSMSHLPEADLDTWRRIYGLYRFLTTSSLSIRLHGNDDQGELVEVLMESKLSFPSNLNKI